MKKRNHQIDALRAILILAIVFFHYTIRFTQLYHIPTISFLTLSSWGSIGVGSFFIISGYFLRPSSIKNFSIKQYLKSKLIRLYPAYIFCLILIFISVSIFGLPGREVSFTDFLLNIPFLNGFIGAPYVDGAHWYVTYLLIFSILVAIVLKTKIKAKYYLPAWLIVKDILLFTTTHFSSLSPAYRLIGGDYVEFIIIGLALAELLRFKTENKAEKILFNALIAICILQKFAFTSPAIAMGIAIFCIIFLLAIKEKLAFLERFRLLLIIGDSSYVLYLLHQNIGYQIILAGCSLLGNKHSLLYGCGTLIIMCIASIVIHIFYETPTIKFLSTKMIKASERKSING